MDERRNNPYAPPEPGAYQPDFEAPDIPKRHGNLPIDENNPQQSMQTEQTKEQVEQIEQKMKSDVRQGKFLSIISVFMWLIVLGAAGAGAYITLVNRTNSNEEVSLSTDDILRRDLRTFAEGVNRYNQRNSNEPLTITPNAIGRFKTSYVPLDFKDPRTNSAYIVTNAIPVAGEIQYILGGICNEDDSISQSGNNTNFASRILLEDGYLYCIEASEARIPTSSTN